MVSSVAILGGGLAGLAAGVRLAQQGTAVTLIETSRRLGGRATSHDDPQTGQTVDNCQHVLLGCCTNLVDLYRRLGVAEMIRWEADLHFFDKLGHHDILQAAPLPAPLHLSPSMMRFGCLTLREKVAVSRGMLAIMRLKPSVREQLNAITFEQWLLDHGQPRGAIDKFWAVVIVSALNQWPSTAAADSALQVFQEGFLAHRDAYRMGVADVPLSQLYDPARQLIEQAGGTVRLGTSIKTIKSEGDRVTGLELADGERLQADAYISALPFDRLAKVADANLRQSDDRLAGLAHFTHSPILGIHLWFDRPVVPHPHMIYVDSPLQWVFVKGTGDGERMPANAQYLHGVISAADEWVGQPAQAILDMAVAELTAYLPETAEAKLLSGRVIKEKRATFAPVVGLNAHRPGVSGRVANLLLAGDWTDTGWPATMEGAVRSGYRAAAAATAEPGDDHGLVADLPAAALYRLVAATAL
ncbi:MAG: hydroxysqualene dehydroxylase HpnE [Phycisphaeraceae bacterium]